MAKRKVPANEEREARRKIVEINEILASTGFHIPESTRKELEQKIIRLREIAYGKT